MWWRCRDDACQSNRLHRAETVYLVTTRSHSDRIPSTATAALYPQGGIVGERLWLCMMKVRPSPRLLLHSRTLNLLTTQPIPLSPLINPTPEQTFLAKDYDRTCDTPIATHAESAFSPMHPKRRPRASSFSLPTVECALAVMVSSSTGAILQVGLESPILGSVPRA